MENYITIVVAFIVSKSPMFWFSQLVIPITGALAISLSQSLDIKTARWACIFGLLSQPFWFYSTWASGQYGIFAACFLYLLAWLKGFRHHWLPLILKDKNDTIS